MTASIIYAPISQSSRTDQVVERLSNAIVTGLLEPQAQLPSEADLARLLGVSPVTVREALNTLRARQLIDTRRGRNGGSFVCQVLPDHAAGQHPLRRATTSYLADLGEFHRAVAGHSAWLAAQRSTAADLRRFDALASDFAAATRPETRAQADMRCLLALAAHGQSARLANHALEIQAEWAPLVTALYRHGDIHAETVAAYRALQAMLAQADEAASRTQAEDMLGALTNHLIGRKLQLDAQEQAPRS